ncbi:MAG: hypothetical protein ACW98D_05090 [Promethearchaeota archaeon]|jgi:hypothetical protein
MAEENEEIEPTYVGKNEGLTRKAIQFGQLPKMDPEIAKQFSGYVARTFKGAGEARKTKLGNKNNTKTETSPEFWEEFEKKAKDIGIDLIGYTPVNENYIFKNSKVLGKNAIVLSIKFDWEVIKTAPSALCGVEFFRTYSELGEKVIELTNYLKERGYKSEAHHPFGGKLLYTYHAVAAGLGFVGQNGLIITPEFGPRQRWALITTDADIPETKERDFSEMEDFCKNCGACIKSCKGRAPLEEPIEQVEGSGIITRIDAAKCADSLTSNNCCSVCLKICSLGQPKK